MKRYHLDANVVLRFLRNDDARQSSAAKRLIAAGQAGTVALALSAVTLAEVFYVLRTSYKMARSEAADLLGTLLRTSAFEVEHEARMLDALGRAGRLNVDFGDAYLAATAVEDHAAVASFDGDFRKFGDLTLYVPSER